MSNIYLAGGMKSEWQDYVISRLPEHSFIDPRSHGLKDEKDYTAWDLLGIRECSLLLAYMDSENPSGFGLSLEVGYAKALGKTIYYVCEDATARQKYFGMVRACSDRVFTSLNDAISAVHE
jgi:nucleoside 2-deoxyribosyltransferase